jgi:hypothetical protein
MFAPIVRLAGALTLACCTTQSRADDLDTELRDASWVEIGDTAKRFVAEESPDTVWPFPARGIENTGVFSAQGDRELHAAFADLHREQADRCRHLERSLPSTVRAREQIRSFRRLCPAATVARRPMAFALLAGNRCGNRRAARPPRGRRRIRHRHPPDRLGGIWNQARTICATAAALVPNFHIVLEIDSYVFREASVDDIVRASEELATCPAIYHLRDGRVLYVPFAADTHTPEFWREVKDKLAARGIAIAFVPLLQDCAPSARPAEIPSHFRPDQCRPDFLGSA